MDEITINGTTYYIPSEYSYYIIELEGSLTLTRSGSVVIYDSLRRYSDQSSGYPRITIQYGSKAQYAYRSGNQTITQDLSVSSWNIDHKNLLQDPLMSIYIMIVVSCAAVWRLFKS